MKKIFMLIVTMSLVFIFGGYNLIHNIDFNTDQDFRYNSNNSIAKSIKLTCTGHFVYKGTLSFTIVDPENNHIVYEKTNHVTFSKDKPFTYTYKITGLDKKEHLLNYTFTEETTGKSKTKTEIAPYILTPDVADQPRINGADVLGGHPGNPFLYLIPATGKKPLIYEALNLPQGLKLNANTGIITGTINVKGDYPVVFTVHNNIGSATKKFTIKIGDVLGLTPALGWNSWNAWGVAVTDKEVREAAAGMADKLSGHGWNYVNVDEGWEAAKRSPNGELKPNAKFPDMKALAAYVHSLGLRIGIYSSPGPTTCDGFLGSWQHEEQDAKMYGDWGMDYLKYDWCSYWEVTNNPAGVEDFKRPYRVMSAALNKIPRDIMFSFCQYGMGDVWKWGAEAGGNSWRTTQDIWDTWENMSKIGFNQIENAPYAKPGHFNDPDMLVVGKIGWGLIQHSTRLTPDEQYTHVSLWSLLSAPLLIGCDMTKIDGFTLNLLTNDEVLAIDQDALGKQARPIIKTNDYQIWVKDLADGNKAVGIFNTSEKYKTITLNRGQNNLQAYSKIRDVWQQKDIASNGTNYSTTVAPHGVMLVKLSK